MRRALASAFTHGVVLSCALSLSLPACAGTHDTRHGDRVDISSFPQDVQEAYPVFARRCSRCHTLARPLSAHISDPEHWVRYVTRMRRQAGSGINERNADIILRFLTFYATEVRYGRESGDSEGSQGPEIEASDTTETAAPAASDRPGDSQDTPEVSTPDGATPDAAETAKGSAP